MLLGQRRQRQASARDARDMGGGGGGNARLLLLLATWLLVECPGNSQAFKHSLLGDLNPVRWKRQTCSSNQFRCTSGECIDKFLICDGEVNCKDRSDETSETCMSSVVCPSYAFRCDYGACVNGDAKCNGREDCADGSDERGCPGKPEQDGSSCKKNQFRCKSGVCTDPFLLCDGTKDCDDGTDETEEQCGSLLCPSYAFRCSYGACIDADGRCNGVKQCADGSDESVALCGPPKTTSTTTTPAPVSSECVLPDQPHNGKYTLGGCKPPGCQPVPGTHVPPQSLLMYECQPGYLLSSSSFLLCDQGWSSSFPSCARVLCKPLIHLSRDIECEIDGKKADCNKPMAPGTKAEVSCKTHYTESLELARFSTVCTSEGKWTREVYPCLPVCGDINPDGVPYVANGRVTKRGEFPWHAGIYKAEEDRRGEIEWKQVCGGSIVTPTAIVTASHCFWNLQSNEKEDVSHFRIAVGKFFRNWTITSEYAQFSEISEVFLHEKFRGDVRLYQFDIAVVKLIREINMTNAVRPICIDDQKQFRNYFLPGKAGTVIGWGITEKNKPSEELNTATLPLVNFDDCEKSVPETFIRYLTPDKFCAGYRNGTSVCPGDSGGGYATHFKDGKWYLMGIVSVGVPSNNTDDCNIYNYAAFTQVYDYTDFIKQFAQLR